MASPAKMVVDAAAAAHVAYSTALASVASPEPGVAAAGEEARSEKPRKLKARLENVRSKLRRACSAAARRASSQWRTAACLNEERLQGLEHLAEADVRVSEDNEVLKQLPRPRR